MDKFRNRLKTKVFGLFETVQCINLQSRRDRLNDIKLEFNKLNIPFNRFNGIVPEHSNDHVNIGTYGCKLSHLALLSLALKQHQNILICEDDIVFSSITNEIMNNVKNELPPTWDMLYLGINHWPNKFPINGTCKIGGITKPFTKHLNIVLDGLGAHCYAVNHVCIPKLIDHILSDNKPIDVQYATQFNKLNVYCVNPILVGQKSGYSDIDNKIKNRCLIGIN